MGRLIVIEGNSGVGKSTATIHLTRRLGAKSHHFPPEFLRFREAVGMDENVHGRANLAYHLGGALHLADTMRAELTTTHVVADRYLPGPLSLIAAQGHMEDDEMLAYTAAFEPYLVKPALTVLLVVSHGVASERIRRRASGKALRPVERWTLDDPAFFARREASLRFHAARLGPVFELDTSELAEGDALARIDAAVDAALGEPAA